MSEGIATPAIDAPAAAAPAVAVADSAPTTGAESPASASASAAPEGSAEQAALPAGAPAPTQADDSWPEVEWGEWDGETDSLPEQYHSTAKGIQAWHQNALSSREEEIDSLRAMYSAMLSGDEDPRIGQLTKKLEELQTAHNTQKGEYETLQQNFTHTEDQMVQDYVERFWEANAHIREDDAKLERFSQFLEESNEFGGMWDGYAAAELIDLPEEAVQVAVQAKQDGVSDQYALRLAKAHAQLEEAKARPSEEEIKAAQAEAKAQAKAKQPRPGAKITNGATRSARPRAAKQSMGDAKSLDDLRLLASRRAFAVHGGGKS